MEKDKSTSKMTIYTLSSPIKANINSENKMQLTLLTKEHIIDLNERTISHIPSSFLNSNNKENYLQENDFSRSKYTSSFKTKLFKKRNKKILGRKREGLEVKITMMMMV
jgi:hypothetical protein